jgi:hypothetical protein
MASYPTTTKAFTTKVDGAPNVIYAAHVNEIQDEVVALENDLRGILPISRGGIGPYGAAGTVLIGGVTPAWSAAPNLTRMLFADGTAAAPSIAGVNFTTTGWMWPGAGAMDFVSGGTQTLRFSNNALSWIAFSPSPALSADAASVLALRNGINPQTFRVYNTFTDASNYERATFGYSSSVLVIGPEQAGTGFARQMKLSGSGATTSISFATSGTDRWRINGVNFGIEAVTDNTQDIGAPGAFRPRAIYTAGVISCQAGAGSPSGVIHYEMRTAAGLRRWIYYLSTSESSGNLGSNLAIAAYDDAGSSFLYSPITFSRTGGANGMTFGTGITVNADNAYDLGTSGSRFRNMWLGGGLTTAGQLNVTASNVVSARGFNGSFSYSATDPMVSMTIGNWAPRMSDLTSGYTLDYQDDAAFADKWAVCTLTANAGISVGTMSTIFVDDSNSVGWNPATSPFPIVIEIDAAGIGGSIPALGNGYWNVGLTYRHTGNQNLVTNIKIEAWESGAYVTRYDQAPATQPISGAWLSPRIQGDSGNGFAMVKCRITLSGVNPLSGADTFRIERLMLYHPTTGWDPWRLHRLGGSMYGQIKWGANAGAIDQLLGPTDQPFVLRAGAGQTIVLKDNAGTVRLQVLSTGVTLTGTVSATSVAGDGSGLTNLNATNIATGTLADARLSTNIPLKNAATNTFTGTVAANLFSGSAVSLTNVPAGNLTGTVPDVCLSANIPRLNVANTFTAALSAPTLSATTSVTSADIFANGGWLRSNGINFGLYNSATDRRFASTGSTQWGLQTGPSSGGLTLYSDAFVTTKGYLYWDATGFGLLDSAAAWAIYVVGGNGNLASGKNILMASARYLYPGDAGGTLGANQTSYYLGSHGSWGLYSNTGIAASSFYAVNNISWQIDTGTYITCDVVARMKFNLSYGGGRIIYWDGVQFYPANDGGQNLGHGGGRWGAVYAVTGTIQTSDAREKKNVATTAHGSALLRRLRPVDYEWRDEERGNRRYQGLVAQEVAEIYPSLGCIHYDDGGEASGLNYTGFIAILIKGWQELDERVKRLEALH